MPVRIPLMSSSNVETKAIGGKTTVCGFMNTVLMRREKKRFQKARLHGDFVSDCLGKRHSRGGANAVPFFAELH